MARTRKQPWKRARPKRHTTLTASAKRSARTEGGSRYSNLVDNMRAATRQRKSKPRGSA